MQRPPLAVIAGWILTTALLAVACAPPPEHEFHGQVADPPTAAPSLAGTNWDGASFALDQLEDRAAIIFFGYTYCPDVCPMTLAKMKQLYRDLGDRSADLAVVFVSVDPQRDTVEKLGSYVPNFDPRFYGLRLDVEQLETIQDAFDLTIQYGQPRDGPGTDSYYYVDHTGTYLLLDRQHRIRVEFPPNATVEEMLPDVEYLLDE